VTWTRSRRHSSGSGQAMQTVEGNTRAANEECRDGDVAVSHSMFRA
jgi:hypothetical protein